MSDPKKPDVDTSVDESQVDATSRRAKGEFVRGISQFRNTLEEGSTFPPEPGRYHLFVALNCPWCHRVTLARNILGLQGNVTLDVAFPNRTGDDDPAGPNFWEFDPTRIASLTGVPLPECTHETATGRNFRLVQQIYQAEGSDETSVPILYDKASKRIVANESSQIIRMLSQHATALGSSLDHPPDLYPKAKRDQIDELNSEIYADINNGAYKAGFSSDQKVYSTAFGKYFSMLDKLNTRLSDARPFLTGDEFTEADLRLFPTLYRHDPVYYLRMKLNGAKILDYPHLWRWLCRVHGMAGVADSNSLTHCRQGYFGRSWNGVVPLGPLQPMPYPEAFAHPELARE
ncbi:MAG: glutathione S-transferase [Silicimonas sp.]|nr:glutathione S-transferase [Silicimonas sp.]